MAKAIFVNNPELRSLVRIYILKQGLNDNFIPRSIIISNLKKISKESPYDVHRKIAKNVLAQMDLIYEGEAFPFEKLVGQNNEVDLTAFQGKYIYLHAFNPSNTKSINELSALKKLKNSYGSKVEFITLYVNDNSINESGKRALDEISWVKVDFSRDSHVWTNLGILTFPYYILIDRDFNVVSAPSLGPSPNGKYETIERTFYDLSKP